MKYTLRYTKSFRKDFGKLQLQEKDLTKLEKIIETLAEGESLDKKFIDHPLRGEYKDCRECHIEPDWLLIYYYRGDELILVRTGTHSELFR